MIKLVKVFKVRIVYKSGYTHDFEATKRSVLAPFDWMYSCEKVKK